MKLKKIFEKAKKYLFLIEEKEEIERKKIEKLQEKIKDKIAKIEKNIEKSEDKVEKEKLQKERNLLIEFKKQLKNKK